MKMIKNRILIAILTMAMLLTLVVPNVGIAEVKAATVTYTQIQYGVKDSDNWGYLLIPKGVSGKLQAGVVFHGMSSSPTNSVPVVKNAVNSWDSRGYTKSMIYIMPMMIPHNGDCSTSINNFSKYVKNYLGENLYQV